MVSSILLARVGESDGELLLGISGDDHTKTLKLLGAVSPPTATHVYDSGFERACHNIARDVGGLLAPDEVAQRCYRYATLEPTKLTLYIVKIDSELGRRLPAAYERVQDSTAMPLPHTDLLWVSWEALIAAVMTSGSEAATKRSDVSSGPALSASFRDCRLSTDVIQLLTVVKDEIGQRIGKLRVKHEHEKIKRQAETRTTDRQLSQSLSQSLHLTSRLLSRLPVLEVLEPLEPDYKAMLAVLPSHIAWRVVSIRRVRAPVRHNEFEQHKETLSAPVEVKESLFHGTPERWRATAIALHGFDTSIKLNGRSFGDGVYATSHMPTALRYAGARGSIVQLRGLMVSDGGRRVGYPCLPHDFHVFPDPKAVLPLLIADYAKDASEMK